MRVSITADQLTAAFETVRDEGSFEESRRLHERGQRPTEMIQAMALRPEILRAFGRTSDCVYPGGLLERRVKELVIVEASRRNACQFCRDSHVAVMRLLGIDDDPIAMLDDPSRLAERERLAVEYTAAVMTDANRVPEALFDRLRERFSEPEIVELTFLVGYINMLNMFNNALRVTYHGEYEGLEGE